MKNVLIIVFPLLFLIGCSSYISRYFYNYKYLDSTHKNLIQSDESFGRYNHYFEDDFIKLNVDCTPYEIGLYIHNKTDSPIRIIWDSVKVFSDYLNNRNLVINHSNKSQENLSIPSSSSPSYNDLKQLEELKKRDNNFKIEPSIILANDDWMDEILFSKNVTLLPYELNSKEKLINKSESVIGNKIKLVLPIKINDKIKDYTFIFTVEDFKVLSKG